MTHPHGKGEGQFYPGSVRRVGFLLKIKYNKYNLKTRFIIRIVYTILPLTKLNFITLEKYNWIFTESQTVDDFCEKKKRLNPVLA
jgi:hypothetical protein